MMTVKECYQLIGNYAEASARLGTDERIRNYLKKFRNDQSMEKLCAAIENKQYEEAFICIHNLKGVYLNLALTKAGSAASELCEMLRGGTPVGDVPALLATVKEKHREVIQAVSQLLDSPADEME